MHSADRGFSPTARAFTLIELLVVIGIIAILIGIVLVVGSKVTTSGRARATETVLKVLDNRLTEYMSVREAVPSGYYADQAGRVFPIIDGRYINRTLPIANSSGTDADRYDANLDPPQPTTALFMLQMADAGGLDDVLAEIDPKLIRQGPIPSWAWRRGDATLTQLDVADANVLIAREVLDAWGQPIRMVHPAFTGGSGDYYDESRRTIVTRDPVLVEYRSSANAPVQRGEFTRSILPFDPATVRVPKPSGDADEGIGQANRPYFYSAGHDGDPGRRGSNVYLTEPRFQAETTKLRR